MTTGFGSYMPMVDDPQIVLINQEPVELYKILKFEGIVASGAEAKQLIADGAVKVNGQIETRKRKKMMAGDSIETGDQKMLLQLAAANG